MSNGDHSPHARQLLFFDQRSTKRLLEVYVKRSLSLNDAGKRRVTVRKWVMLHEGGGKSRRASSDISTQRQSIERILRTRESEKQREPDSALSAAKLCSEGAERKSPKTAEPARKSFLRFLLQWFSSKGSEGRAEGVSSIPRSSSSDIKGSVTRLNLEGASGSLPHPSKAVKKKHSLKRISFRNRGVGKSDSLKKPPADMVKLPDAVCVEPTNTYFENVSMELERIVKEMKGSAVEDGAGSPPPAAGWSPQPDDVTVDRIITLMKQYGDSINEKIQKNSSIKSFFQKMSYSSFQQLADQYISQMPRAQDPPSHTAPELVKLAFTLDFTAKVAGLSSQAVSRIMGFGNQYLQDRFTQMCSVHSQVAGEVEKQCNSDPE